jgi:hypothetical protein
MLVHALAIVGIVSFVIAPQELTSAGGCTVVIEPSLRCKLRRKAVTNNFLESFSAAGLDMWQDYNEFLEENFLCGDEPGSLGPEEHTLQAFYGLYTSLSDDSGILGEVLDTLCKQDFDYESCADDDERDERRDEIVREVSSHLQDGLYRCGRDRSEILQATNWFDEILADNCKLIDEIYRDGDPGQVEVEAIVDEIGRPVADLASSMASSSWFPDWEKHTYTIDEFARCLRDLRAQQDRDLAALKNRAENEVAKVRSHFRQQGCQSE